MNDLKIIYQNNNDTLTSIITDDLQQQKQQLLYIHLVKELNISMINLFHKLYLHYSKNSMIMKCDRMMISYYNSLFKM